MELLFCWETEKSAFKNPKLEILVTPDRLQPETENLLRKRP
jgi:hypothetical protein